MSSKYPNVLSIAGVDPSGGAGILADIKTISALGGYACGVVTAITAQNTCAVEGVMPIPTDMVAQQIDTLFKDVRIDAVKIGMLFDAELIGVVADKLRQWKPRYVVLDPVMVAKSGDALLQDSSVNALRDQLLPLATVITPNLPEAERLLECAPITSDESMQDACLALWHRMGNHGNVMLKGGHREQSDHSEDVLYDGNTFEFFDSPRFKTKNTHGTGCALSSAIACLLPQSPTVRDAVAGAKAYISNAIAHADELDVGYGHGPLKHFVTFWK